MARIFRRQVTARTACLVMLVTAALPGCSTDALVAGKPPERVPRELEAGKPKAPPDRNAAYKQREADAAARGEHVETPDAAKGVVGVASTHVFHRPGCAKLKGVPAADQIPFTSPWSAIDDQYSPCSECNSWP
jgi:hypothetical protein